MSLIRSRAVAGLSPKLTEPACASPAPVIVTIVPPSLEPLIGASPAIVGAAEAVVYVKRACALCAESPCGVTTVTGTVPDPGGVLTCTWVSLTACGRAAVGGSEPD